MNPLMMDEEEFLESQKRVFMPYDRVEAGALPPHSGHVVNPIAKFQAYMPRTVSREQIRICA